MYYFGTKVFSIESALIHYLNPKYKVKSKRYKHLKYHKNKYAMGQRNDKRNLASQSFSFYLEV